MTELLKSVDSWFMILMLMLLGLWFVWSIKNIFQNFQGAVTNLKDVVSKLDLKYEDHEKRLVTIEVEHKNFGCNLKDLELIERRRHPRVYADSSPLNPLLEEDR